MKRTTDNEEFGPWGLAVVIIVALLTMFLLTELSYRAAVHEMERITAEGVHAGR